jgi:hypothetical protein
VSVESSRTTSPLPLGSKLIVATGASQPDVRCALQPSASITDTTPVSPVAYTVRSAALTPTGTGTGTGTRATPSCDQPALSPARVAAPGNGTVSRDCAGATPVKARHGDHPAAGRDAACAGTVIAATLSVTKSTST